MKSGIINPFDTEIEKVYGPYTRSYPNGSTRRQMVFVLVDGRKTSMSYARWLMTQKLGRLLASSEHVDHRDEDPTNDSIENLQILTRSENSKKSARLRRPIPMVEFTCPECNSPFSKSVRQIKANQGVKGRSGPYCGRSCAGRVSYRKPVSA